MIHSVLHYNVSLLLPKQHQFRVYDDNVGAVEEVEGEAEAVAEEEAEAEVVEEEAEAGEDEVAVNSELHGAVFQNHG